MTPSHDSPLTLAEAHPVLFWSFFVSQGNTVLHEELFRYVAQHRLHWRLSEEQQAALFSLVETSIHKLIAGENHMPVQPDVIESDLKAQIGVFGWLLNKSRRQVAHANEVNLRHIIRRLIQEDGRYLGCTAAPFLRLECRANRYRYGDRLFHTLRAAPPLLDAFFSFICAALLGKPLGVPVFAELMTDIRRVFLEKGLLYHKAICGQEALLKQVVGVWNWHHPYQQIDSGRYLSS
jgi:hypothetical protein